MNLHEERGFTMSTTFVAPCASVVGDVRIIDHSCVWYGAVIRGRLNAYRPYLKMICTSWHSGNKVNDVLIVWGSKSVCGCVVCEGFMARERHTQQPRRKQSGLLCCFVVSDVWSDQPISCIRD